MHIGNRVSLRFTTSPLPPTASNLSALAPSPLAREGQENSSSSDDAASSAGDESAATSAVSLQSTLHSSQRMEESEIKKWQLQAAKKHAPSEAWFRKEDGRWMVAHGDVTLVTDAERKVVITCWADASHPCAISPEETQTAAERSRAEPDVTNQEDPPDLSIAIGSRSQVVSVDAIADTLSFKADASVGAPKIYDLAKFRTTEGVPPGACAPVWLSIWPARAHAYCNFVGEAGHSTCSVGAHAVPAGWRRKWIALCLVASAAPGSTLLAPLPAGARARWSTYAPERLQAGHVLLPIWLGSATTFVGVPCGGSARLFDVPHP